MPSFESNLKITNQRVHFKSPCSHFELANVAFCWHFPEYSSEFKIKRGLGDAVLLLFEGSRKKNVDLFCCKLFVYGRLGAADLEFLSD